MQTQKHVKDCFINSLIGNETELYRIFKKDAFIHIADIGACDGLSTIHYAKMFPNATFQCFEPIPENADEMFDNFVEYGISKRAVVHTLAVSNYDGTCLMHVSSGQAPNISTWNTGNKSSSIFRPTGHIKEHPWCKFEKSITVPAMKFDSVQQVIPSMRPTDFMHIDVQGAELLVLQGAKKELERTTAIWIEVSTRELYQRQALVMDIMRFIKSLGFKKTIDTLKPGVAQGDQFWSRI